jgi:hypothetical protein
MEIGETLPLRGAFGVIMQMFDIPGNITSATSGGVSRESRPIGFACGVFEVIVAGSLRFYV